MCRKWKKTEIKYKTRVRDGNRNIKILSCRECKN